MTTETDTPPVSQLTAIPAERIHSLLRRMSDQDWLNLKELLNRNSSEATREDIGIVERMFRYGEDLAGHAGGTILRVVQRILANPALLEEVRKANERIRARVRFALREMSDAQWEVFQKALERILGASTEHGEIKVLTLVYRIGESVSNVEIAALALEDKVSGHKWIAPEIARRNAWVKAARANAEAEAEAAYLAAKRAAQDRQDNARRAENTLAYAYVEPTKAFKHARNTVFKLVDLIAESSELMAQVAGTEQQLLAIPPLTRDKMRWTLHRMPTPDRLATLKFIPLNTILMFQEGEPGAHTHDRSFRATRDRRLAYDLFLRGLSDEQLSSAYGLSINAVKNTVGMILQTVIEKPLARKFAIAYLESAEVVPHMSLDEVRRAMKRISSKQRAEILDRIPNCVWKARQMMSLHKRLFLDYLSGEWVLAALVDYYNLEKEKRLTGMFKHTGTLTVRGATSAMEGILHKIADEPNLRQQLRCWSTSHPLTNECEPLTASGELTFEELIPPMLKCPGRSAASAVTPPEESVLVRAAAA